MQKLFQNLKLRTKLIVSHGLLGVLALLLTLVGLLAISQMISNMAEMHNGALKSTAAVGDVLYYIGDIKGNITGTISQRSNAYFDAIEKMMNGNAEALAASIETLKTSLEFTNSTEAEQLVAAIDTSFSNGESVRKQILSAIGAGDFDSATMLYGTNYILTISDIQTNAKALKVIVDESSLAYFSSRQMQGNYAILFLLAVLVICLAAGALMTIFIIRAIRVPVQQLQKVSEEMKNGNLSVADMITYEAQDEIGHLAQSMRETIHFLYDYVAEISRTLETVANGDLTMRSSEVADFRGDFASIKASLIYILENLNSTLFDINQASTQVNSGASQIAGAAQTLAQGASEQTSSVDRLSTAVASITEQVNMTAQHSFNAKETMQKTTSQVQECNDQMNHMITAMDNITQQASQISKIVKTIEDIAFQTNILALNAAVEAARAGAAGKGFAVVADEVRSLAAKSAEASQNTSTLIGGTVDAINDGTKILSETAQTLLQVVEGSQNSAALVDEIALAAKNQADSVAEISQNIDQISNVVYTTSSTAEQSAAASEELSGQAATLNELLGHFRLRNR